VFFGTTIAFHSLNTFPSFLLPVSAVLNKLRHFKAAFRVAKSCMSCNSIGDVGMMEPLWNWTLGKTLNSNPQYAAFAYCASAPQFINQTICDRPS